MIGERFLWLAGAAAAMIVALVLWQVLPDGGDASRAPEAIGKVAGWLGGEGECPEGVDLEASRIPVGPHGPPGAFFRMFGGLPEVGALTACTGTASGFIGWFRFPSASAMEGALRRHPEMTRHEPTCTRGSELLIDSLLGYDGFFPEFCRRLGFEVHPPTVVRGKADAELAPEVHGLPVLHSSARR